MLNELLKSMLEMHGQLESFRRQIPTAYPDIMRNNALSAIQQLQQAQQSIQAIPPERQSYIGNVISNMMSAQQEAQNKQPLGKIG